MEALVAVGILVLLGAAGVGSFVSYSRKEALDKNALKIEALLEEARSLTLSSRGDTQYGVHLASNQAVLFQGAAFSSTSASNKVLILPGSVVASTTLAGGGADVVFDRLRGTANTYGTTTLSLSSGATTTKSIIIYKTGLIEKN